MQKGSIVFFLESIQEAQIINTGSEQLDIRSIITDSRQVVWAGTSAFFAISGQRHNGHEFLIALYAKGCRCFIVSEEIPSSLLAEAWIIKVPHVIHALQQVAAAHRSQFHYPVVGITGSNGKTIIKEYAAQLLEQVAFPVRNPHSYNSQIGVPLSVWGMNARHNVGLFEAGISTKGEMAPLEKVIQPTIGLFSNIGSAHDEGFADKAEKVKEKALLFVNVKTLIYCRQHTIIHDYVSNHFADKELISWKIGQRHLTTNVSSQSELSFLLGIEYNGVLKSQERLILPYYDDATLENAIHASVLVNYLFPELKPVQEWAKGLAPIAMRMQRVQGVNGCTIIDDSYSLDLAGLEVALRKAKLWREQVGGRFSVVISDFAEAGKDPEWLYAQVQSLLKMVEVDRVFAVGRQCSTYLLNNEIEVQTYYSTSDFLQKVQASDFQREIVLIKGARTFGFEAITKMLSVSQHSTRLEIDLDALTHNLNFYKSLLKPETKIMAMVKAFAYGSGSFEVAKLLQYQLIDYLAVAYTQEGVSLREKGIMLPIMVMNPANDELGECLKHGLEPVIFSLGQIADLQAIMKSANKILNVHLEIDTGMARLGFTSESELQVVLRALDEIEGVQVQTVFSHLVGADTSVHDYFSKKQIATFSQLAQYLEQELGYSVIKHILNSSGIIRFPASQMDMVRLGIGLYGIEPNEKFQPYLKTVATFKTSVSQIHELQAGESVGYNRAFVASKPCKIATIPVGYADGFRRSFSKGIGQVRIHGKLAPVAGMVCMDMTMIDISDIDTKVGDEVILFDDVLTVSELAAKLDTIPYEILTNIHERVKRVFVSA